MSLQKMLRPITVGLLFIIPIFPLIVVNSFFFPFITGKAFFFRIVIEVAFAAWILLACADPKYRPRLTPLSVGVTVFALVALVADLLGVHPVRSLVSNFERMEGWLVIAHLWMLFIAASSVFGSGEEGRRSWHHWFNASLIVACIVGIYGFFQLFGLAGIHQGSTRIDASLGNAAYMAVYMLIHIFIAAYLWRATLRSGGNTFLKWAYPILGLVFTFLLFETATRGTILGLIGGVLLALALYAIFAKNESRKSRSISAGVLVAIILIGGIFWLNRDAAFIQKSEVLQRLASISWNETRTQARAYIWPMAIEGFKERPVLGWGQENFNYLFNAHYHPEMYRQEQWFDRAHSVFLDWLVAAGAIGLIAYLALYVLSFMAIWKSSLSVSEKSVLTGLLAGYAVHNIFVFDNLASYAFFFAILAFISSLKEGKQIRWLGNAPLRTDAVEYVAAPIVLVALVAGLYFLNVRPIQANTRLLSALRACGSDAPSAALFDRALKLNDPAATQEIREQLLSCSTSVISNPISIAANKQAFYGLAMKELRNQIAETPDDARIYTLGGSFLTFIGQYDEAVPVLETAYKLSPKKQSIAFQLATGYINQGKNEEAVELLREAYEAAPEYSDAKAAYATALIVAGREAEARKEFNNDPSVFETERMAQIYASLKQYSKAIAIYEKLIAANPKSVEFRAALAQIQDMAGLTWQAVQTLRGIEKDRPDLKEAIEKTIEEIQK